MVTRSLLKVAQAFSRGLTSKWWRADSYLERLADGRRQLSFGFREDSLGCDIPPLIPTVAITRLNMKTKRGKRKAQSSGFAVWHHMDGV
jgi:hypothetical protein